METRKTRVNSKNNSNCAVSRGNREESMGDGALYVKVMTDEQLELLRLQIAAYATICEQLIDMHKNITARNDSIAGMRLGNLYCDPLMTSGGHKLAARQRWTPTPVQLQILESIFKEGNGTPSKQKIKEITRQLIQHGQISETNVYNWFQNRRARSKRKQPSGVPNNSESEAEAEIESPDENKAKSQKMISNWADNPSYDNTEEPSSNMKHRTGQDSSWADNPSYNNTEQLRSNMKHYTGQEPNTTAGMSPMNSKSSGSLSQMSFYENILSNPRMDQYMGKIELHGSYSPFQSGGSYDLSPL